MSTSDPTAPNQAEPSSAPRLHVRVQVQLPGASPEWVTIERGAPVLDETGQEVGHVAGVVMDGTKPRATHLLIGRWQLGPDYRVVSLRQVADVEAEGVRLRLSGQALGSLAAWSDYEAQASDAESRLAGLPARLAESEANA